MISVSSPLVESPSRQRIGFYILMLELGLLPIGIVLAGNQLSWRWQFCNSISGLNLILSPLLLSGAIWLALPPSNWRSIAKFCMISTGLLYVLLAFFLISFICLFPQRPNKEIRLKNGDTISVGYNDQGAMGGNVSVWRERPYGPFFFKLESRTLGWCDPEFITLPDGKELISITGEEPMAIDEFFQSNGKRR